MKLALIRQRYTPFGGAERFMDRAITALGRDAEVTEVAVFAREWRGEAADYRFVECNPPHHGNVSRDRNFVEAVKAALAKEPFDLVQSHERMTPEGINAPFVYRAGDGVHATWLRERARAQGKIGALRNALNPYHRYMVNLETAMFTHANLAGVICNSHMVRDDIAARFAVPDDICRDRRRCGSHAVWHPVQRSAPRCRRAPCASCRSRRQDWRG